MEAEHATTEALTLLVNDDRFNGDTNARISGDNEATVMLYSGHEDEQREIIKDEFGLAIDNEQYGVASGDTIATVVDPNGDDPEAVDTNMDADEAISMF